jgi:cytochrome c-type biogenesis protein CcmH
VSHRLTRTFALLTIATALVVPPVAGAAPRAKVSLLDAESQLICTSCHEPLELAQSPEAQREKAFVASLIAKGDTMTQIKSAMVAQYGVEVLGEPPARGFNLLAYVLPPVLLVIGIVFLVWSLPRWRARSRAAAAAAAAAPQSPSEALDPGEQKRLDDELARFL